MGYMSEIAGNWPEEYLNDNLIFKCLVTKQIEESDAKPDKLSLMWYSSVNLDSVKFISSFPFCFKIEQRR